jgi:transcriptional regulator with XRE-family HTH domain
MELKQAFGEALRRQRKAKGLTQEAFGRTYLSELERGTKSPSLEKIDKIAGRMGVHPLTLLTECFSLKDDAEIEEIFAKIVEELASLKDN